MSEPIGEIRTLVLRVDDMDAECRFLTETLGFELKFRDGNRWAQFAAGAHNLALAGEDQRPVGSAFAVNVKVANVQAALDRAVAGGAVAVKQPTKGEHELSASFRDPSGHLFYVYSSLPKA